MTPSEAIRSADSGSILPVYLVVGEESVLAERVVRAVRTQVLAGGMADFNLDVLDASQVSPADVLSAAKTAPMMAPKRLVLVRGVEVWDKEKSSPKPAKKTGRSSKSSGQLELLADFIKQPMSTTCLVMTASKLDKRRKLFSSAKKKGFVVSCESLSRWELPKFIEQEASRLGHSLPPGVAEIIADVAGPNLAPVLDALERLSLYVGQNKPILEDDVAACITRVRPSSVWDLVAAVADRDVAKALRIVSDVYDPRDNGLPLVGALVWSTRQMLTFSLAREAGMNVRNAAVEAKIPNFKVKSVAAQVRNLSSSELQRWLLELSRADRLLKSSKMKPLAILEQTILTMTSPGLMYRP